jgi:hypothetical protein
VGATYSTGNNFRSEQSAKGQADPVSGAADSSRPQAGRSGRSTNHDPYHKLNPSFALASQPTRKCILNNYYQRLPHKVVLIDGHPQRKLGVELYQANPQIAHHVCAATGTSFTPNTMIVCPVPPPVGSASLTKKISSATGVGIVARKNLRKLRGGIMAPWESLNYTGFRLP